MQVTEWLLRLVPLVGMAMIVSINLTAGHWRTERRSTREAARLVIALRAELEALRDFYQDNLELLAQNATCLLSARGCSVIYRGNVSRLPLLLDEQVLAPLVAAFAFNERLEARLAVCSKRGGGPAQRIEPEASLLIDLTPKYVQGCEAIELALQALAVSCAGYGAGFGRGPVPAAEAPVAPACAPRQFSASRWFDRLAGSAAWPWKTSIALGRSSQSPSTP